MLGSFNPATIMGRVFISCRPQSRGSRLPLSATSAGRFPIRFFFELLETGADLVVKSPRGRWVGFHHGKGVMCNTDGVAAD